MELISLKDVSIESKIKLIEKLGYRSDGIFVLDETGSKVIDKYIDEPVKIDNMFIAPGSTIFLDNNPLSVASFIEEFGEIA